MRVLPRCLVLAGLLAMLAVPARALEGSPDDLEKQIQALRAEIAALRAQSAESSRMTELERRIDLLAAEVEKTRTGGASEPAPLQSTVGLAPAASKVYGVARGVSIGGYGEAVYENPASHLQDGTASDASPRMDLVRGILYTGYKFSDTILFNSELEVEHASTGEGAEQRGEVSLEFAYLDFRPKRSFGVRVGEVLIPMGFVNELHEPPIFHGAHRPVVEDVIIPTTWRENGAGIFGEAGHFAWRSYLVAGLDSAGFVSESLGEGRQEGSNSLAHSLALTGRLDFTGVPGLVLGGSFFAGDSGQGAVVEGQELGARVSMFDLHAQYEHRGLQLRALGSWSRLEDAALVNIQNGLEGDASVGERQYGFYVEAAYDLMSLKSAGRWSVVPFVRYERLNPQDRVPAGYEKDAALDQTVVTAGVGVKPLPNVVLKSDVEWLHNEARTGSSRFSLAMGYLF